MFLKLAARFLCCRRSCAASPFINLKSDPQKSLLNQQIYPSIKPGYHMNKKHWISVYPGEEISKALLRDLINDSWNLVVDGIINAIKNDCVLTQP
ncbi:MmcQ/YjbR family DNA-binding protein [Escherichia coli]